MKQSDIKQFVLANPKLAMMKSTSRDNVYVLKYNNSVFFKNLWNEFLEQCRGTVVDGEFNVISRPFTKIYNFGVEERAPKISNDTVVTSYRKVNGFMVSLTWYDGDILVSTTGSIDSDFVTYAKEMMLFHASWDSWKQNINACRGRTLMFECVHPLDPHICPENIGMYFIGHRNNTWDSTVDLYGDECINSMVSYAIDSLKCYATEGKVTTMGEVITESKSCKHEGFVVYTDDGRATKIKSPYYLVQKFMARVTKPEKLLDINIKERVEEEYYPLVDAVRANIDMFMAMDEQSRLEWIREFLSK